MELSQLRARLSEGMVIPAHPLALNAQRQLDERYQRALTRYYLASGVGGLAVGVHTTQFAIHDPAVGLYKPVLDLAAEEMDASGAEPVRIAGIVGQTKQAVAEAAVAREAGYHAGLLSLGAMRDQNSSELLQHCRAVAEVMPVFGFYLQPSVGGLDLDFRFWREFVEIADVVAIKIAAFNRYRTLDVVRALAESGRRDIALYTGNDDNIVIDLFACYRFSDRGDSPEYRFAGGLLGHWAVWTRPAVQMLNEIKAQREEERIESRWLERANAVTDCNAAFFDPQHDFAGCIPGLHEVLYRQGLLPGTWTLDEREQLSAGQLEEIERVADYYPELSDDEFVREHLDDWLS